MMTGGSGVGGLPVIVEEENNMRQTPVVLLWHLGGVDDLNQDNDFIVGSLESVHDNNGVA